MRSKRANNRLRKAPKNLLGFKSPPITFTIELFLEPVDAIRAAELLLSLKTRFIVEGNPARFHWSALSLFCLLYLAVIGSAITFLLLYWLLPRMTVARLQSISLITPPGAVMLGWVLGGESFPISSLLGAALVLAGVWMIFRKGAVREPVIQEG